jgi:hypothetical protein
MTLPLARWNSIQAVRAEWLEFSELWRRISFSPDACLKRRARQQLPYRSQQKVPAEVLAKVFD